MLPCWRRAPVRQRTARLACASRCGPALWTRIQRWKHTCLASTSFSTIIGPCSYLASRLRASPRPASGRGRSETRLLEFHRPRRVSTCATRAAYTWCRVQQAAGFRWNSGPRSRCACCAPAPGSAGRCTLQRKVGHVVWHPDRLKYPPTLGRLTHMRSKHPVLSQLRVVHKADRPPPVAHPCPFCLADSHPATPSPRCPRAPVAHRSACWQALLLSDSRCAKATSISDHVSARAASACADVYIPGPIGGARRATAVGGSLRWSACPAVWPPCKCAPGAARPREYPPP